MPHGNTGNRHAQLGDYPRDAQIALRVTTRAKNRYIRIANKRNISLAQLIVEVLDKELK